MLNCLQNALATIKTLKYTKIYIKNYNKKTLQLIYSKILKKMQW